MGFALTRRWQILFGSWRKKCKIKLVVIKKKVTVGTYVKMNVKLSIVFYNCLKYLNGWPLNSAGKCSFEKSAELKLRHYTDLLLTIFVSLEKQFQSDINQDVCDDCV